MNKSLAVLLTCHNRREKTIKCLGELFKAELPEGIAMEVFLVDDGSVDGTSEAVKSNFPLVNVIQGNGNLFWNRGMYLAWENAAKHNFDFYLWLNDDTNIFSNTLKILFDNSKEKNYEAIICGICKSKETGKISYGGFRESDHQMISPNGHPQPCYFFNGNVVLIPKTVFESVGNLDYTFKHEFGDFAYGLKARKKGFSSWVSSEIVGLCENNELKKWCNPKYPLLKRIQIFYSPLGLSPFEHFVYAYRYWSLKKAISTFFSLHLRLLFPRLWLKNNA